MVILKGSCKLCGESIIVNITMLAITNKLVIGRVSDRVPLPDIGKLPGKRNATATCHDITMIRAKAIDEQNFVRTYDCLKLYVSKRQKYEAVSIAANEQAIGIEY